MVITTSEDKSIRIGGASGYWGDASLATSQLLANGNLDYIVYDYLAEITMAILARLRANDPAHGYAADFITGAMAPNLTEISRQGVKIVSNAGGINPEACAQALRKLVADQGLDLRIATVTGDDLIGQVQKLADQGHRDMFSVASFPDVNLIGSVNAYLGAFPIAAALDAGADIVITGRCVDSAVTLGACLHEFGWNAGDFDALAAGSLAGHILECGTQATGGNFTDWDRIEGGFDKIGYPIAEITADGIFTVSKPKGSGGMVSIGTVAEQLVYEIGDPQAYLLPDVTCDFSDVRLTETEPNVVRIEGTQGKPPSSSYKTCLTWHDGFRGGHLFGYYGIDAEKKAGAFADAALRRSRDTLRQRNMPDFTETSVEILGAESQFGAARQSGPAREVNAKIAVKHPDAKGVGLFLKEATGLGLSSPPGLSGFAGARPKPSPVLSLFSFLLPKDQVAITVKLDGVDIKFVAPRPDVSAQKITRPNLPKAPAATSETVEVPLLTLAWGRSGDKGDTANIGVIARKPEYLPYIWSALDETRLREVFGHFLRGEVHRYLLPGLNAMNIVLTQVLAGGGTSSLRNDPQGKGYAQLVLASTVTVPKLILET